MPAQMLPNLALWIHALVNVDPKDTTKLPNQFYDLSLPQAE
jgi:hypothetical protein